MIGSSDFKIHLGRPSTVVGTPKGPGGIVVQTDWYSYIGTLVLVGYELCSPNLTQFDPKTIDRLRIL